MGSLVRMGAVALVSCAQHGSAEKVSDKFSRSKRTALRQLDFESKNEWISRAVYGGGAVP
jgi:hypothetical protein